MISVLLHGSYFSYNFGDYLFLDLFLKGIARKSKEIKVLVPNASAEMTIFLEYPAISKSSKLNAYFSADAMIYAPGGYFGEPNSSKQKWTLKMLVNHVVPGLMMRIRRVPYCILGIGVGPLTSKIAQQFVKIVFNGAKFVSVRDEESKKHLEQYGVKRKIQVVSDAAIVISENYIADKYDEQARLFLKQFSGKKIVFLHINLPSNTQKSDLLVQEIAKFSNDHEDLAFVIGFDNNKNHQDLLSLFCKIMPEDRTAVLPQNNPYFLVSIMKNVDATITTKLHVGIISVAFNKSVLSFAEHSKTKRFYSQIGERDRCLEIGEMTREKIQENLERYIYSEFKLNEKFRVLARENFLVLDEFLNEI